MTNYAINFVQIQWRSRTVSIEYQWFEPIKKKSEAVWLLLHEGLGSLAMWRQFPQHLADHLGCEVLAYSRPGYGQSTVRTANEEWGADFLHQQAYEVLPAFLQSLGLQTQAPQASLARELHILGHSDGASIALLFAARYRPQSIVVMAPHVFVEDISIRSIQQAKMAYETTDLPQKLARYHQSADSAFWGWNRVWLSPEFRSWTIVSELKAIACPILAIQGEDDEYGTFLQIDSIAAHCSGTTLLKIANCKHSPHKDQTAIVSQNIRSFFAASLN